MISWMIKTAPYKIMEYIEGNLGAPFIIGFQVFLVWSAYLMIRGDPLLADKVAGFAYYSLVFGVILQLVSLLSGGAKAEKS